MTVYRLPALDWKVAIVDRDGRPSPYLQRFWQNLKLVATDGANQSSDISALTSAVASLNGQVASITLTLAGKAPLASPAFTGNPTAPTPSPGDNDTSIATTAFVQGAVTSGVSGVVDGAPTNLNTLAKLAAAIGDDPAFAATVGSALGGKVAKSTFETWAAATGTAERTTFATYDAPTASATYDQAEMQAVMDAVQDLSRRLKALIDDLKT